MTTATRRSATTHSRSIPVVAGLAGAVVAASVVPAAHAAPDASAAASTSTAARVHAVVAETPAGEYLRLVNPRSTDG